MRNSIWKRSAAFGLAVVMTMSMAGCGKKSDGSKDTKKQEDTKNYVYQGTPISIDGMQGSVTNIYAANDKLYLYANEWDESTEDDTTEATQENTTAEDTTGEAAGNVDRSQDTTEEIEDGTPVYHLYECDADGGNAKEIQVPEVAENQYINTILPGEDGNVTYLVIQYSDTGTSNAYLVKADPDGKELMKQDVSKDLGLNDSTYVSSAFLDAQGNVIVFTDQEATIFDSEGKKQKNVKSDDYIDCVAKTKDGSIVCGISTTSGSDKAEAQIKVLDTQNGTFGDTYKVELSYFQGQDSLISGAGDYDFYYKDSTSLYGYKMKEQKADKLLDFVASNMNGQNMNAMVALSDGSFVATEYDSQGNMSLNRYAKVDPSEVSDKITLQLGGTYIDENIKEAVIAFNKVNDKYAINIKDYSNSEDPQQQFAADIVAGNIPDIIYMSDLPLGEYVNKGVLEDLTSYFEKEGLDKDLIGSVAEAMQTDGKFYYVSPSASISTIVGNSDIVGTKTGWTVQEFLDLANKEKGKSDAFSYPYRSTLFYTLVGSCMSDYVDWSTGECQFDSPEIKAILEYCKEYGKPDDYELDHSDSLPKQIREGKVYLSEQTLDMQSTVMINKMFNDKACFIGYPCKDGNGTYLAFNGMYSISAKSQNKEGAWEFLKSLMTKEYQAQHTYYGIPTRQDAYEMYKKEQTTTESYVDEFGKKVEPMDSSYGYDDLEVHIGPLSDDEIKVFEDVLNHATRAYQMDSKLMNIFSEEVAAYFADDKSVDDVCKVIQNRVSTYVNENR